MMNNYSNYGRAGTYYTDPAMYPSPNEKRRIRKVFSNTAWALLVSEILVEIFYFALMAFLSAAGFQTYYTPDGELIMSASVTFLSSTSVTFSLICTTLIFGSGFKFRLSDLFDTERITAKKLLLTVLISIGAANVIYVINALLSSAMYYLGYDLGYSLTDPVTKADWAAEIITSVVLAPVFEELFYRGVIMRSLSRVSRYFAIFASSAIFGLAHGNIYQFFLGFAVGIVFAYADMKMNSIIPSVIAHMVLNAHLYIYYAFSGRYEDLEGFIFIGICIIIGTAALLYVLKKYGLDFPEFTERQKKCCLPVLVCSAPAWIYAVIQVFILFGSFKPIE